MSDQKVVRRTALARSALLAAALAVALAGGARSQTEAPAGDEKFVETAEDAPAPFAIRAMRDGTEIEFSGEFVPGAATAVIEAARGLPRLRVVHLSSIGGSVAEGEMLYRYIRDRGLKTYVSSDCLSACALAFAGGRERWIGRFGRLGYHSPSGSPEEVETAKKIIGAAMRGGFGWSATSLAFVERALATPQDAMWLPTTPELVAAGMVSAVSDGTHFALSGFGQDVTPERLAVAMSTDLPVLATLNDVRPAESAAIFAALHGLYVRGDTEASFISALLTKAKPLLEAAIPHADDDVVIDMLRLGREQASFLAAIDPALCRAYFEGDEALDLVEVLPTALTDRGLDVFDRALRSAKARPDDANRVERLAPLIAGALERRIPEGALVPAAGGARNARQDKTYCDASIEFVAILLEFEQADVAAFVRNGFPQASPPEPRIEAAGP